MKRRTTIVALVLIIAWPMMAWAASDDATGNDIDHPIPFGQTGIGENWEVTLTSWEPDAPLEEDRLWNGGQVPEGYRVVLFTQHLVNTSDETLESNTIMWTAADMRDRAEIANTWCSVGDARDIFFGGRADVLACVIVPADAVGHLVLYTRPDPSMGESVFFAPPEPQTTPQASPQATPAD